MKSNQHLESALRVLSDAWEDQRRSIFVRFQLDGFVERLPDLSFDAAQQRATAAQHLLTRVEAVLKTPLPIAVSLALRQARYRLKGAVHEAEWYWNLVDLSGGDGLYGLFGPSAYTGGFALNLLLQSAQQFVFSSASDLDRYLAFVNDYARMVEQIAERTAGQAARGIRIPRPRLPGAREVTLEFRQQAQRDLLVTAHRIPAAVQGTASVLFLEEVRRRIQSQVIPAFERLAAILGADYEALAPTGVGMGQYEGGAAIYAELVKLHTTTELTPQEVHERGLARMEAISSQMRRIRADAGMADDPAGYLARAAADPRFLATTTEGVSAVFQRYIDRMDKVFDSAFHARPKAPHGVIPLPEALEGSMTFGYYQPSRPNVESGNFHFNARNMRQQPLLNVASLNYHELVPGHHLHLSLQGENETLHPLGQFALCGAFNEGWAEYAATLAGEMGMYEEPEERYGRLIMDQFLTCRLVVDTGMNALGWDLERARDYMRRNSSMSETEIRSESLRYACDIPAQALAYKLGDTEMMRLREKMRAALGDRFDLRDFHAAVLGYGALPLPDLGWHLERLTERRLAQES